MEALLQFYTDYTIVVFAATVVVVLSIVAAVVVSLISRRKFISRVLAASAPGGAATRHDLSDTELLRRSALLERIARKHGAFVVQTLGVDQLWSDRLQQKERATDFHRVIEFGADKGLFSCFLVALGNRRRAAELRAYLEEHSDFLVLRKLALSGRGESFSGKAARDFFADRLDEIREMAGDPEWPDRYFAVKILVHDPEERSTRALDEAFDDPHALVRRTVAEEAPAGDRQVLADKLMGLFVHDPVLEVRKAARGRLAHEFSDLYTLDIAALSAEEAFHVVSLLDEKNADDQNAALALLAGKNLELRLGAARYLVRAGVLQDLLRRVDFGDRADMQRTRELLMHALSVNVNGFLSVLTENPSPATLMLGAELLGEQGDPALITELAERVLRIQERVIPNFTELFTATVHCVAARGNEAALGLLAREINRRRDAPDLVRIALDAVPSGRDLVFRGPLLAALKDPSFPEREGVRTAFLRLDPAYALAECLDIVTAGRKEFAHRVRIDALKILGELKLAHALQDILEHLAILPTADAREFAAALQRFSDKELERKVGFLLGGVDGSIRAAVIAALPGTGKKTFLAEIRAALKDADPDVRIAAAWALVDYEETRALGQAVDMLRDPVERVRVNVARALSAGGGPSALKALRLCLEDENEVIGVKCAVIEGLGSAKTADAVDSLVLVLETDDELRDPAILALASKRDQASITRLVERFKDADPEVRTAIGRAFSMMGEDAESTIRDVLEEGISSLKPHLVEILESTGYVDSRVRRLSHRDPRQRRDAASFLSLVGSAAAFRGIVMAARDPDPEVRVEVTKALEELASDAGNELLAVLENDPDRRIRKYTHWALERVKAKSL